VDEEEDDDVSGNGGTGEATRMDAKMTTKTYKWCKWKCKESCCGDAWQRE
jgi:hypothetical protein